MRGSWNFDPKVGLHAKNPTRNRILKSGFGNLTKSKHGERIFLTWYFLNRISVYFGIWFLSFSKLRALWRSWLTLLNIHALIILNSYKFGRKCVRDSLWSKTHVSWNTAVQIHYKTREADEKGALKIRFIWHASVDRLGAIGSRGICLSIMCPP